MSDTFSPPAGMLKIPPLPDHMVFLLEASSGRISAIADEETGTVLFPVPSKKDLVNAITQAWATYGLRAVSMDLSFLNPLKGE